MAYIRKRMESVAFVLILGPLFWIQPAWADSFLWNDGTFTTFNVPGALPNSTVASGVNDFGEIVGSFVDGTGEHGFLYANGVFTTINVPGSTSTVASGINDAGQIVGSFGTSATGAQPQSFLYSNGVFSVIDSSSSAATGINNEGEIVGSLGTNSTNTTPYVYKNGHITPITVPFTNLFSGGAGINDSGQIVGTYFANVPSGFLDSNGVFSSISVPGANGGTYANGINNSGDIAGFFGVITPTGPNSFGESFESYLDDNGAFTIIDFGGLDTFVTGINNTGEVVGNFVSPNVPEPSSLLLLGSGLAGLSFLARRKRSAPTR